MSVDALSPAGPQRIPPPPPESDKMVDKMSSNQFNSAVDGQLFVNNSFSSLSMLSLLRVIGKNALTFPTTNNGFKKNNFALQGFGK